MPIQTIDARAAARALEAGELQLVDIRPPDDVAEFGVERALHIPFGQLESRLGEVDDSRPVAFLCRVGVRSVDAAELAVARGYEALSVEGGAVAWRAQLGVTP